jgi:hypothetical protein
MKILVVSAHPDDVEIACAGTLRRYQEQGAEVISVIAVQPSAEANPRRTHAIVSQELTNSYALSGWNLRIFPTPLHSGGRPNLVVNNVNMTHLHDLLETCDIAIIPNPEDSHQDHRATYELVWPYVKKHARQTWLMHSWPYCHDYNHAANHYVEIAEHWDFKRQLLDCYKSYLAISDINNIHTANQFWAQKNRQTLAECFTIVNSYE